MSKLKRRLHVHARYGIESRGTRNPWKQKPFPAFRVPCGALSGVIVLDKWMAGARHVLKQTDEGTKAPNECPLYGCFPRGQAGRWFVV
jgi:hypothetical protein